MSGIVGAYADGGVIMRNPSTVGGTWAWCHVDADECIVESASGVAVVNEKMPVISNNYSEYIAAVRCLAALPEGWSGTFYSDSEITIGRLFYEWALEGIPDALYRKGNAAMKRLGKVTPVRLDGHPTKAELAAGKSAKGRPVSAYNVWCDEACRTASIEHIKSVVAATGQLPSVTTASTMPSKDRKLTDVYE